MCYRHKGTKKCNFCLLILCEYSIYQLLRIGKNNKDT
jgi:hypothetical protein